jgi:hypothetical protein
LYIFGIKKTAIVMTIVEEIQEQVLKMPHENRKEVLDFAKFLANNKKPSANNLPHLPNKRGSGKAYITYIADDFDAPLDDLK